MSSFILFFYQSLNLDLESNEGYFSKPSDSEPNNNPYLNSEEAYNSWVSQSMEFKSKHFTKQIILINCRWKLLDSIVCLKC